MRNKLIIAPMSHDINSFELHDLRAGHIDEDFFGLANANIRCGSEIFENTEVQGRYDIHGELILRIKRQEISIRPRPHSLIDAVILADSNYASEIKLLSIRSHRDFHEFTPSEEPISIHYPLPTSKLEAIIINGPNLERVSGRLELQSDQHSIIIEDLENVGQYRRDRNRYKHDRICTQKVTVSFAENSGTNAPECLESLHTLLTFIRGGACGLGHARGEDEYGETSFLQYGFYHSDHFKMDHGWCRDKVLLEINSLYCYFADNMPPDDKNCTLRSIGYYRASNAARPSGLKVALVASYAGLETIMPYILLTRGDWSKTKINDKKIPFHTKIKACSAVLGIDSDPFGQLSHFRKRAERGKSGKTIDAYEMLSQFRNKVTHYKEGFFTENSQELYEAWNFSQWLLELSILYLFKYQGIMFDRRMTTGYVWDGFKKAPISLSP